MLSDKSSELLAHNLHGTFVSQKINKIRWKPERMDESHFFVTGSVDCDENKLTLWDLFENQEEDDIYPFTVSEYPYCGDVTEIKVQYLVCSLHKIKISIFPVCEP